jgi:polysaccharide biosynthesis/export protein
MAAVVFLGGCESCLKTGWERLTDPSAMVRSPEQNLTNPIYTSASSADETQELAPGATAPTEDDLKYSTKDYIIGAGDVLDISVLDLFSEGLETVLRRQVTEGGMIDLPLLPEKIKADGLTQAQLQERIVQGYSPDILKNPTVAVTLVLQKQDIFSIIGAVARPGTYNRTKKDMRLLEAIAAAGGTVQTNIRWLYVIRPAPASPLQEKAASAKPPAIELPPLPTIPPEQPSGPVAPMPGNAVTPALPTPPAVVPATKPGATGTAPADADKNLKELNKALPGLDEMAPRAATPASAPSDVGQMQSDRNVKYIHSSSMSTRVEQNAPTAKSPSGEGAGPVRPLNLPRQTATSKPSDDPFNWKKSMQLDGARIIAIDIYRLNEGNPRMNIIIRDNDIINIPPLEQGEFYVMGEVLRPGVYSLTGRRVTVKMAVAAAGNLSQIAWPSNSILIRRIGDNQEQLIPINVEAIFHGEQPDMFLKADDVVAVGTHWAANFMAVFRNAFRLTYGFGFIYDRNFSLGYPQYGPLNSDRFTRW